MHYPGRAFAIDTSKPTITYRSSGETAKAQRTKFSDEDVKEINALYKCGKQSACKQVYI